MFVVKDAHCTYSNSVVAVADVVADGRTLGSFEPKNDYVVDIPMGSSLVNGNAKGISILD